MWLSLQKDTCCIPAHKLTVKYKWAPHFALLTVKCENSHVWFEQGSWPSFTSVSRWNVVQLWFSAPAPHSVCLHNTWNKTNQSDNNRTADVSMLVMLVWSTLFRSPLKKICTTSISAGWRSTLQQPGTMQHVWDRKWGAKRKWNERGWSRWATELADLYVYLLRHIYVLSWVKLHNACVNTSQSSQTKPSKKAGRILSAQ